MTPTVEQIRGSVSIAALAEIGRTDVIADAGRRGDGSYAVYVVSDERGLAWRSFTMESIHKGDALCCWECWKDATADGLGHWYGDVAAQCPHEVRF